MLNITIQLDDSQESRFIKSADALRNRNPGVDVKNATIAKGMFMGGLIESEAMNVKMAAYLKTKGKK